MTRIGSRSSSQKAPVASVGPRPIDMLPASSAGIRRDFPLARVFTANDYFPTDVDADIRALRRWERRRDLLIADLPDPGEWLD